MKLPAVYLAASLGLAGVLFAGCVRTPEDLPPLLEGVTITGQVFERDLPSADLVPAKGAIARIVGTSITSVSDDNGFFQLQRVPLGRRRVVIERRAQTGRPALARSLDPLNVIVDRQSIDLGTIELYETGSLTGFVGTDENGTLAPLGGALIVAAQTAYKAIAGEDGRYLLGGLPEGPVDIVAFQAGYEPARVLGVRVGAGARVEVADLVLVASTSTPTFDIRSRATLADRENESAGIAVRFIDERNPTEVAAEVSTIASGAYGVTLAAGVYRVRFEANGYRTLELNAVAVLREGVIGLEPVVLSANTDGDFDGDGIPDAQDPDRDNDGCANEMDAFPNDAASCADTDGDGIADELDFDDDNDQLIDAEEDSPGLDGWVTDRLHADSDRDGFDDAIDVCPTVEDPGQADLDRDGRGDACDRDSSTGATLEILALEPDEGPAGTLVTIRGRNFTSREPALVLFANSDYNYAINVTPTAILVEVPEDAATGPITLFHNEQVVTSTAVFTFRPAPEIIDYSPRFARINSFITVVGDNFRGPNLQIFIGPTEAMIEEDPNGMPLIDQVIVGGEPRDRVRARVPAGTTLGEIRLQTDDGISIHPDPLTITLGPEITRLSPQPATAGQTLLIVGNGFQTDDTGGDVTVTFPGVAMPQTPTRVTATTIRVIVPSGTTSGTLTVNHLAGASTAQLIIDDLAPAILDLFPTLVRAGNNETVTITGRNLGDATGISFGGVNAPLASVMGNTVTAIVPAGAMPGEVVLMFTNVNVTAPEPLRLLTRLENPGQAGTYAGAGFCPSGTELELCIVRFNRGNVLDDDTLDPIPGMEVLTLPFTAGRTASTFQVEPGGGRVGIITTNPPETYVVDLPSFTLRGSCADAISTTGAHARHAYAFDGDRFAYAPRLVSGGGDLSILRVNLTNGACQPIGTIAPMGGTFTSVLYRSLTNTVLVGHSTLGQAELDVDPTSPLYGTFVTPWATPVLARDQMFFGFGESVIYARDSQAGDRLARLELATGRLNDLIVGGPGASVQSRDQRWLLSSDAFIDLEAFERVRTGEVMMLNQIGAVHPSELVFVVGATNGGIARLEILE